MIPKRPIRLETVFDEPDRAVHAFARNAPYELLQGRASVMTSAVEQAAITGAAITDEMIDAASSPRPQASLDLRPTFRGYWLLEGRAQVDDLEWLIEHPRLVDAARRLHGGAADTTVRPFEIYAHIVCPDDRVPRFSSHVDIPNFRGLGRRDHPTWLLTTMRRSGLFDRWHTPAAVAVIWFYRGAGGRYSYWPDGPDAPPATTDTPAWNTAVMGENDTMFHTGHDPQPSTSPIDGLSTSSTIEPAPGGASWRIVDGQKTLVTHPTDRVRFALSWSALVLDDPDLVDDHRDDLDLDKVVELFRADLAARGSPVAAPDDPHHDPRWVALLARTYRVVPSTSPSPRVLVA